ncbi:hypothetical protein [Spiroplasma taiwanense]|uniref:MOLPALP family lipoprotein n=1 Tax=Spiroplasma taiwanense CT-1 TaxID=1276220 RepID=S5M070_9MOLU|nr:hypothetical protein [Spiroplasma taiwanense]AGR41397.1 hypothetical protein STAIW_v1c08090 [Spiroplasma taiwanense CT-1]
MIGKLALGKPILSKTSGETLASTFSLLNNLISLPFTEETFKKLINSISATDDTNTVANGNLFSVVWNNDIWGYGTIQNILTGDLGELFGLESILGFEILDNTNSLKSIIEKIQELINGKPTKIDFSQLSSVIKGLAPIFSNMPTSVEGIVNLIEKDSALLDSLISARENMNGLYEISNWVNSNVTTQKAELIKSISSAYKSLTIAFSEAVSSNEYSYNLGQGRKVTIKIKKIIESYTITEIKM